MEWSGSGMVVCLAEWLRSLIGGANQLTHRRHRLTVLLFIIMLRGRIKIKPPAYT